METFLFLSLFLFANSHTVIYLYLIWFSRDETIPNAVLVLLKFAIEQYLLSTFSLNFYLFIYFPGGCNCAFLFSKTLYCNQRIRGKFPLIFIPSCMFCFLSKKRRNNYYLFYYCSQKPLFIYLSIFRRKQVVYWMNLFRVFISPPLSLDNLGTNTRISISISPPSFFFFKKLNLEKS